MSNLSGALPQTNAIHVQNIGNINSFSVSSDLDGGSHGGTNETQLQHRVVVQYKLNALETKLERILEKIDSETVEAVREPDDVSDNENICSICLDQPAIVQTLPCQHAVVCQACFLRSIQSVVTRSSSASSSGGFNVLCSICRTPVMRAKLLTMTASSSSTSTASGMSSISAQSAATSTSDRSSASSARSASSKKQKTSSNQKSSKNISLVRARFGLI